MWYMLSHTCMFIHAIAPVLTKKIHLAIIISVIWKSIFEYLVPVGELFRILEGVPFFQAVCYRRIGFELSKAHYKPSLTCILPPACIAP